MKVGVLWFPGWSSSENDLIEMMDYLKDHGIEHESINLKGHNTNPGDLYGVTYHDWLSQAEQAYKRVSKKWDIVFVGGLSMGGQLAFYLASKYNVAGVISIGTPLRINTQGKVRFIYYMFIRTFAYILRYIPYQITRNYHFLNERIRQINLSRKGTYKSFPISSVVEVYLLTKRMRRRYIKRVTAPTLLIQSTTDHLVSHYNIDLFQKRLQTITKDIHIMWVKDSYHLVNLDHHKDKVFDQIYAFIKKYSMIQEDK